MSVFWRPCIFSSPLARDVFETWIGRMPMLHINDEPGIALYACVAAFQPMIEPAHRFIPPLNLRARRSVIWERVVPRADNGLHRTASLHQHVVHVVAIAVEQTADEKTWNGDFFQGAHTIAPEWAIMLMFQIE